MVTTQIKSNAIKLKNEDGNVQLLHFYKLVHKKYITGFLEFSLGRIYNPH